MKMEICTSHDDVVVVYEARDWVAPCPLCQSLEREGELEAQVESAEQERDDLKEKVEELQTDLDEAQNQVEEWEKKAHASEE